MLLFIPRSLCALKRVAAKSEPIRFGATQGIRIAVAAGLYRAEATDGHRAIAGSPGNGSGVSPPAASRCHRFSRIGPRGSLVRTHVSACS